MVDEGLFKTTLPDLAGRRQPKKLEYDGVANEFPRVGFHGCNVGGGLFDNIGFVSTHQQSLVVERIDLAIKGAAGPVQVSGFFHVPLTRFCAFDPQQSAIVSPAQFETQCVSNWEKLIKQAHFPKIGFIKPLPELRRQILRQ